MLNATHYGYELMGTGLHGRNRKAKFFTFELSMVPVGEPQPEGTALMVLLAQVVAREKVKPGATYKVIRRAWEITPPSQPGGFGSKATEPLRYDTLKTGTIE